MTKKKTKKKSAKKKHSQPLTHSAAVPLKPNGEQPPKITPYPEAGKKVTEFEEKLDRQIAGEATSTKRGRGRPRKEMVPEPEFAMSEDIIRQTVKMPFDLWAVSQKLEELKLKDQEAAALASPVKQLLDYYLPNMPTIAIAWVSLTVTSYSIMVTRLSQIAEIKKQKQSSPSPDSVNAENVGHGGPRSPDSPAGQGGKIKFPDTTEPVKI